MSETEQTSPAPDHPELPENVVAVDGERWQRAQACEKRTWVDTQSQRARFGKNLIWWVLSSLGLKSRYRGDDWNYWWREQFDNYAFLPAQVENAIELGCGPYTNFRLIEENCRARHLVLSDPLIATYIGFKLTYVRERHDAGTCSLDDHSIEECPYADNYFDLVVMINVLDHVRDAARCMERAMAITRPGGHLLIGQNLTDMEDLIREKHFVTDEGHPIRLRDDWLDAQLGDEFDPVVHKVLQRVPGRSPEVHYGVYVYAGIKRDKV